jgi:hypothetical protein
MPFAVIGGVFVGLPVLFVVGLIAYHTVASTWISWRFKSNELNAKIVSMNAGWNHSSELRDIASLFPEKISRDVLQQQLEGLGYVCKVETLNESGLAGVLSCKTQAGYDAFCTRSLILVAVFDDNGAAKSISANPYVNC